MEFLLALVSSGLYINCCTSNYTALLSVSVSILVPKKNYPCSEVWIVKSTFVSLHPRVHLRNWKRLLQVLVFIYETFLEKVLSISNRYLLFLYKHIL